MYLGQYFVLTFDFSTIGASRDILKATSNFHDFVNRSVKNFYDAYAEYIEQKDAGQNPISNLVGCVHSVRKAVNNNVELKKAGVRGIYLLVDGYACENILLEMKQFFNGYHFCMNEKVESVFNTETCLEYLQRIAEKMKPNTENSQNSEVSPIFLNMFATSAPVIAESRF